MKKRLLPLVISLALVLSQLTCFTLAASPARLESGENAAQSLYELGLFRGVGTLPNGKPDFALARTLTRAEAVTMVVRLLGAEDEAMNTPYSTPFTDVPEWARPYVGYAYSHGITSGVSATSFGAQSNVTLPQFLTFILRTLGYGSVNWADPYPTADTAGLYYPRARDFCRADAASISLDALTCTVQGRGVTLFKSLQQTGVISAGLKQPPGAIVPGPDKPAIYDITVSGTDDMVRKLYDALSGHPDQITIRVPQGQAEAYVSYLSGLVHSLSWPLTESNGFQGSYSYSTINFVPTYSDSVQVMAYLEGKTSNLSAQNQTLLATARKVHDSIVTPGMSEYARVLAFHDWLVNNNSYDTDFRTSSFSAYGALVTGSAVCDGYSKAFDLLCYLSGIECIRVTGSAYGSPTSNHAWNKVKINDKWYNVDVTWDDPIASRPVLSHTYFLVSDKTLSRDHSWTAYSFWPTAASNYS